MRGGLRAIEVETVTVVDLIREHGVPHRMKIDIVEDVDYLRGRSGHSRFDFINSAPHAMV